MTPLMVFVALVGFLFYRRQKRIEREERERLADGFSGYGDKEMFARAHSNWPEDRMHVNVWKRTDKVLQRAGARRTKDHDSYLLVLGCTQEELVRHIESQFRPGMTWSNYGDWHVDHIRPCSSFDLTSLSEQSVCFHYTNLQPLWAADNLGKRDRYRRVPGDLAANSH